MTDLNQISEAFKSGFTIKLENRGAKASGITFELRSVFDEMVKKGLIKDTDGKGLTTKDALNMYAKLNEIHNATNRATNYTRMQVGQEFNYTAEELKQLALASGYELIGTDAAPEPELIPEVVQDILPEVDEDVTPDATPEDIDVKKGVPEGAKLLMRSVNGKKQPIAVFKDKEGDKVRRAVIIDEKGNQTLGEKLIPVSTAGKNKYITESQMVESYIKPLFPDGNLPQGLKIEFISQGGDNVPVFKKDGKTLGQQELKEMAKAPVTKETTAPSVTEPVQPQAETVLPDVEPSKQEGAKKLAPEEVRDFMNKDTRILSIEGSLGELERSYNELKAEHDAAWNSGDFDKIQNGASNVDVMLAKNNLESARKVLAKYQSIIENWQDGEKWILKTGSWAGSEFETTTLPNGQKGYKFEKNENGQKVLYYFDIGIDAEFGMAGGLGDMVQRVVVDENK